MFSPGEHYLSMTEGCLAAAEADCLNYLIFTINFVPLGAKKRLVLGAWQAKGCRLTCWDETGDWRPLWIMLYFFYFCSEFPRFILKQDDVQPFNTRKLRKWRKCIIVYIYIVWQKKKKRINSRSAYELFLEEFTTTEETMRCCFLFRLFRQ